MSTTEVRIIDNTEQTKLETELAVERALEIIGGKMMRYAALNCPVDTGLLRNSLTYALDGEQAFKQQYKADVGDGHGEYDGEMSPEGDGKRSVAVGTNVEYAESVEFNEKAKHTVGRAHFIRDSVATHISEYAKILENEMKKALK